MVLPFTAFFLLASCFCSPHRNTTARPMLFPPPSHSSPYGITGGGGSPLLLPSGAICTNLRPYISTNNRRLRNEVLLLGQAAEGQGGGLYDDQHQEDGNNGWAEETEAERGGIMVSPIKKAGNNALDVALSQMGGGGEFNSPLHRRRRDDDAAAAAGEGSETKNHKLFNYSNLSPEKIDEMASLRAKQKILRDGLNRQILEDEGAKKLQSEEIDIRRRRRRQVGARAKGGPAARVDDQRNDHLGNHDSPRSSLKVIDSKKVQEDEEEEEEEEEEERQEFASSTRNVETGEEAEPTRLGSHREYQKQSPDAPRDDEKSADEGVVVGNFGDTEPAPTSRPYASPPRAFEPRPEMETLLHTIKTQFGEIESLKSTLRGLREGREMFLMNSYGKGGGGLGSQDGDGGDGNGDGSGDSLDRSLGRSHGHSHSHGHGHSFGVTFPTAETVQSITHRAPRDLFSSSTWSTPPNPDAELDSNSTFVEKKSSSYMFNSSPSASSPLLSSNIISSNFGLTSFDKTHDREKYVTRKDEALENLLNAFVNST